MKEIQRIFVVNLCRNSIRLFLIGCLLQACSHYDMPNVDDLEQSLATHVTASGIKQFEYNIQRIREPGMSGRHSRERFDNGRRKIKTPAERNRDLKQFAHSLLKQKMLETGYCLSGYILYEELLSVGNYKARGECREGKEKAKSHH